MRKQLMRLALMGSVAAAATLGFIVPAQAATWTVTCTNNGDGQLCPDFSASNSGTVTLTDNTHGTSFSCPTSSAAGTINTGTGLSGSGIGTVTSSSWSSCTGSFGSSGSASQVSGHNESINAISYSNGVTTGNVSNVDVTLHVSDIFGTCTATVTGTADSTYTNPPDSLSSTWGELVFTGQGNLTIASATGTGCAGVIQTGDSVSFKGTYLVTPTIVITSP